MKSTFKQSTGKETFFEPVFSVKDITFKSTDKVCIIDGDGSKGVDNLALMKISAFEKRMGVQHVKLIKLKHKRNRKTGDIVLDSSSLDALKSITTYERVYASFIFTRSKPLIQQLLDTVPHAIIGGTGADEYFPMLESEHRAKPKRITQLPVEVENMYPDFGLYESPEADLNIHFWTHRELYSVPKKIQNSIKEYGILPKRGGDNTGGAVIPAVGSQTIATFDRYERKYGLADGRVWRGGTRGSGYSSKGCHRMCSFCVVPVIQGKLSPQFYGLLGVINWVLPIGYYPTFHEITELFAAGKLRMRPHIFRNRKMEVKRISAFLTISDNNFPADHTCLEKFDFMIENDIAVNLNQGMDARLLTAKSRDTEDGIKLPSGEELCERLSKLHFTNFNGTARQLHFSWDYYSVGNLVLKGLHKLVNEYGLRYSNFMLYCLSGYNTTFEEDTKRIEILRSFGIDPFIMLFRNIDGSEGTMYDGSKQDWRLKHLTRWVNNKILYKATEFEKYKPYLNELNKRNQNELQKYEQLSIFEFLTENVSAEHWEQLELFDWLEEIYIEVA
ncbi:hypothetical protein P9G84_02575 [Brevibacillus centrosporus]|uniref:hypothetical protein n=1 Tax=Brevibacillus centrosporus TaxID=54910 RepID=UPI001143A29D|nr:hypothetical protein [Brevibacillus centrosporus]MEC2127879.1 hypothetical protein [Brevibacillus centrosporus]GED32124.1 hypothetical protein BCE02nite_32650 [Brevibacillus centrosporus]